MREMRQRRAVVRQLIPVIAVLHPLLPQEGMSIIPFTVPFDLPAYERLASGETMEMKPVATVQQLIVDLLGVRVVVIEHGEHQIRIRKWHQRRAIMLRHDFLPRHIGVGRDGDHQIFS